MLSKILFIAILLFPSGFTFGQYQIPASVFGNGGNSISGSNFKINSTVGQTFIGKSEGGNFKKQVGFWKPYQILTPVEELKDIIPKEYKLEQNYPNPFNPSTTISYQIPEESNVILKVYDIIGRELKTLVNEVKDAGIYKTNFNASNLASGIYFYRLEAKSKVSDKHFTKIGKMILLK